MEVTKLASRRILFVGFHTFSRSTSYRSKNHSSYNQVRYHSGMTLSPPRSPGGNPRAPGHAPNAPSTLAQVVKRYDDIVKSQEDKRQYRGLELSNRMKVLLVSDPTTDKSAAALDVGVGYLSDPDELPGLAHFCEHMLFLGTEKYPEENYYSKFLSENGGSSNASTSSDHTMYYFDVLPAHLPHALDIFAQFFAGPLFTEAATGRELSAVNSEHDKNCSSDSWRIDQLNKATALKTHPYHKFGTGNKDTLDTIPKQKGIDVRKELLKFHQKWYSANIMSLVVLGKESLDELEKLVTDLFSSVEDKSVTAPSWPEHPFPPELCRKRAYIVPIKDLRSLSIDFPIPDTRRYYKSGPGHYLSHLLGHEGPGSLLSELKRRGWCNSLVGGTRIGARGFGFFGVQVDLTEEGIAHVDDIVKLVFEYISMLRASGPQRWIWEEQRDLLTMEFRFKDAQEPRSLVSSHVQLLQEFPVNEILVAYYSLTEWRPDLIEDLLKRLVPENARLAIIAQSYADKCTQSEPWYGTKYLQEDIDDVQIKEWKTAKPIPQLHLPPPNEFIPSTLEVDTKHEPTTEAVAPAIVKDTPFMRLWYKHDIEFMLPKALMTFDIVSPLAYAEPLSCNLTSVLVLLLRDTLQSCVYAAELAGLRWSIANAKQGIQISIEGYDDKQHVLLEKIVDALVNFKADPQRFQIMKENHVRAIKNFEAEQPYQHAVYHQAVCLSDVVWTRCQLLEAAKEMTVERLDDFVSRFLKKVHIEGMIFGNINRERALNISGMLENKFPKDKVPLLDQQLMLYREIELEKGSWFLRECNNSVHKPHCTCSYYSCGTRDSRLNVCLELLLQTLSEPCFNVLRTQEQLGYIVFSGIRRSNGTQGLRFIVQSERLPSYLDQRIEAFLVWAEDYLEKMPEEEFLKHRSALAAQRLERPKRLTRKASQMWGEISSQVYNFDRSRIEVEQLNTITKQELIEFFKKHMKADSSERRKLSVHIVSTAEGASHENSNDDKAVQTGCKHSEENNDPKSPIRITDLMEFKSRRRLYPHPAPFTNIPRKGTHCKL